MNMNGCTPCFSAKQIPIALITELAVKCLIDLHGCSATFCDKTGITSGLGARMMARRVARFRTYRPAVTCNLLVWSGLVCGHRSALHCSAVPRTESVRVLAEAIDSGRRERGSFCAAVSRMTELVKAAFDAEN